MKTISRRHFMVTLLWVVLAHGLLLHWLALPQLLQQQAELPLPMQINLVPMAQQSVEVAQLEPPIQSVEPPQPKLTPEQSSPKLKSVTKAPNSEPLIERVAQHESRVEPHNELVEALKKPEVKPEQFSPIVTPEVTDSHLDQQISIEYVHMIRTLLEQHKKYPTRARRMRIQGEVLLELTIDRHGHPKSVKLARNSGHHLLDNAVLAMVKNAQPFPALPTEDPRKQVRLRVPVKFSPY